MKTEVQTATMTTRLLVARSTSATQINNQPTTGASKCRGPFGEARAEGKRQSHQRLRCLRSRDQHCKKSRRHLSSADDRRWDDGRVDFRQNKSTRPHNAQASTAGNATNSRGGREREVAVRQEAKTKVKTEVQTATMTTRLLVARSTSATQINNQPTTGASKCRGPFGEARAEGKRQSHQRLRCLRSRDQHCKKSRRHLSSADDRRWDDGRWCNRRRRRTIDGGAGGQGWEDEDDETG